MSKRNIVPVPVPDYMLKYLNTQVNNRCEYIRSLIRKDMQKSNELDDTTKKLIMDYIKENFQNYPIEENEKEDISKYSSKINKIFNL